MTPDESFWFASVVMAGVTVLIVILLGSEK